MFPPTKSFDNFPPEGGWSESLGAFRFFLNIRTTYQVLLNATAPATTIMMVCVDGQEISEQYRKSSNEESIKESTRRDKNHKKKGKTPPPPPPARARKKMIKQQQQTVQDR